MSKSSASASARRSGGASGSGTSSGSSTTSASSSFGKSRSIPQTTDCASRRSLGRSMPRAATSLMTRSRNPKACSYNFASSAPRGCPGYPMRLYPLPNSVFWNVGYLSASSAINKTEIARSRTPGPLTTSRGQRPENVRSRAITSSSAGAGGRSSRAQNARNASGPLLCRSYPGAPLVRLSLIRDRTEFGRYSGAGRPITPSNIPHADLHWYEVHGIGRVSTGIKRFLH